MLQQNKSGYPRVCFKASQALFIVASNFLGTDNLAYFGRVVPRKKKL
jgi:hypothetical protein